MLEGFRPAVRKSTMGATFGGSRKKQIDVWSFSSAGMRPFVCSPGSLNTVDQLGQEGGGDQNKPSNNKTNQEGQPVPAEWEE